MQNLIIKALLHDKFSTKNPNQYIQVSSNPKNKQYFADWHNSFWDEFENWKEASA